MFLISFSFFFSHQRYFVTTTTLVMSVTGTMSLVAVMSQPAGWLIMSSPTFQYHTWKVVNSLPFLYYISYNFVHVSFNEYGIVSQLDKLFLNLLHWICLQSYINVSYNVIYYLLTSVGDSYIAVSQKTKSLLGNMQDYYFLVILPILRAFQEKENLLHGKETSYW